VITNLVVRVRMRPAMVLTSVIVTYRRCGTAHNQLVSISIVLNTALACASLTNKKPGEVALLPGPKKRFKCQQVQSVPKYGRAIRNM
jgi:hypothetical protein